MKRKATIFALLLSLVLLTAVVYGSSRAESSVLMGCEIITAQQAQRLMEGKELVQCSKLLFCGSEIQYSAELEGFLITQDLEFAFGSGVLAPLSGELFAVEGPQENVLQMLWVDDTAYSLIDIIATNLPVMYLSTDEPYDVYENWPDNCASAENVGLPVDNETEHYASWSLQDMAGGMPRIKSGLLSFHLRGATTLLYPKKSMRLHLLNESGSAAKVQLLDMRTDNDWILNAMYTDSLKVREQLAMEVWNNMAAANGTLHDSGSSLRPIELIINGQYCGIYGLQEPLDAKQVGINTDTDYLYHSIHIGTINGQNYEAFGEIYPEGPLGTVSSYPVNAEGSPWRKLLNYSNALYWSCASNRWVDMDIAASICDLDNQVDFYLWKQFCNATDHTVKNTSYVAYRDITAFDKLRFVRIPWDDNYTFGLSYAPDIGLELTNYNTVWPQNEMLLDVIYYGLFITQPQQTAQYLAQRWQVYANDALNAEKVARRAEEIYEQVSKGGALQRDLARWPRTPQYDSIETLCEGILERGEYMQTYITSVLEDPDGEYMRILHQLATALR